MPSGLVCVENDGLAVDRRRALLQRAGDVPARRLVVDARDVALVGELQELRVVDARPRRARARGRLPGEEREDREHDDQRAASSAAGPALRCRSGAASGPAARAAATGLQGLDSSALPVGGSRIMLRRASPCRSRRCRQRYGTEVRVTSVALPGGSHVDAGPARSGRAARRDLGPRRLLLGLLRRDRRRGHPRRRSASRSRATRPATPGALTDGAGVPRPVRRLDRRAGAREPAQGPAARCGPISGSWSTCRDLWVDRRRRRARDRR